MCLSTGDRPGFVQTTDTFLICGLVVVSANLPRNRHVLARRHFDILAVFYSLYMISSNLEDVGLGKIPSDSSKPLSFSTSRSKSSIRFRMPRNLVLNGDIPAETKRPANHENLTDITPIIEFT